MSRQVYFASFVYPNPNGIGFTVELRDPSREEDDGSNVHVGGFSVEDNEARQPNLGETVFVTGKLGTTEAIVEWKGCRLVGYKFEKVEVSS